MNLVRAQQKRGGGGESKEGSSSQLDGSRKDKTKS